MIIQSLEQKTRLALATVLIAVVGSAVVSIVTILGAFRYVQNERANIYVVDGNIPFLAQRTKYEAKFEMEAEAHIQKFHDYFFTLPPDEKTIEYQGKRSLYLGDESVLKQRKALEESGFYSEMVASSAFSTLICDSIQFNKDTRDFKFFGTQLIQRPTNTETRSLITSGKIVNSARSHNNVHGLLITNWKILQNNLISE